MSKPISFGFNKNNQKPSSNTFSLSSNNSRKTNSNSTTGTQHSTKQTGHGLSKTNRLQSRATLAAADEDHDEHDDEEPQHEAVTGFSTTGAILTHPEEEKQDLIIENQGNQDWRRRNRRQGKDLLPQEVRAARDGQDVVMVEKDVVSTASGLQFASTVGNHNDQAAVASTNVNGSTQTQNTNGIEREKKEMTADDEALAALLSDNPNAPRSNAVIEVTANAHDETDDFRADVASRPDSSTLAEYAAMPVEEFGLAMLRGMGRKRRANGEVIAMPNFNDEKKNKEVKVRKQEGFLGIGAKSASGTGMDGVELGAWGKADMRKNARGEGFFTPLMVKDTKTGEVVTEEEMERRKKAKKEGEKEGELEWKERRDRNLGKHGRNRDGVNGSSRRERDVESGSESESTMSRRDKNGDRDIERHRHRDSDYDGGRSRRRRSRSRSKGRRTADENGESDDARYDSQSSRKYRDEKRDRDRERDRGSHRDRHKDRTRDYDRDDRRYRDRDRR